MFTSPRHAATLRLDSILTLGMALATSVSIVALSAQSAIAQSTTTLETISVEGSGGTPEKVPGGGNGGATSGGGGGPSEVTGYVARVSPTATKTNTPLIETPQSVTVLTREQLNDRNVQTVNEALGYVAGVSSNVFGYDPRYDAFYVRGFDLTYNGIFRDGLRQIGSSLTLPRIEPYGLEAATVLRGPASGLYGLGSPGGILDVTTKRPLFTPFGEVQFQAGNYDRYQGNFDIGGPVEGTDDTVAYRLTGVKRDSSTFLPGSYDDRSYIAPAITWKPSDDTTLTFLGEYQESKLPGNSAFFNQNGRITRLYSGDPAFNDFKQQQYRIGYAFEHRFSPDLIVRQNFRFYDVHNSYQYTSITGISDNSASRMTGNLRESLSQVTLDNQVEGHVVTGPVQHTLVAGLDFARYSFGSRSGFDYTTVPGLDLTTLNYGQQTIVAPALGATSRQQQVQVGLYLQEQAKWDRLVLTLTGRHDWVSQSNLDGAGVKTGADQNDTAFTYRVGLNYLLTPGFVPYASYATTFTPQPGINIVTGDPYRPATGDQLEAGVKFAVPGMNITGGIAGFDIRQSSILRTDPTNPANSLPTGEVHSKGFEMEATANLAPGTNLTVAYTHLAFRFVDQTTYDYASGGYVVVSGNQASGIPGDTFAAFATYAFPASSWLSGLTVGGGTRFTTNSFANDTNTVRNPTVTLFDALVAYDFAALDPKYKGFRAQVNGYNVLDRYYSNCQAGYCYRGAPATVIGSLIYRW